MCSCLGFLMWRTSLALPLPVVLSHRITAKLRYYPKDYVREFMAESVSFLLRKAPVQQLKKGIAFSYDSFAYLLFRYNHSQLFACDSYLFI